MNNFAEEHKRKVREYKQAEAAARKMSDAELAKRLEELEKEEEVRNELDTSKYIVEKYFMLHLCIRFTSHFCTPQTVT